MRPLCAAGICYMQGRRRYKARRRASQARSPRNVCQPSRCCAPSGSTPSTALAARRHLASVQYVLARRWKSGFSRVEPLGDVLCLSPPRTAVAAAIHASTSASVNGRSWPESSPYLTLTASAGRDRRRRRFASADVGAKDESLRKAHCPIGRHRSRSAPCNCALDRRGALQLAPLEVGALQLAPQGCALQLRAGGWRPATARP